MDRIRIEAPPVRGMSRAAVEILHEHARTAARTFISVGSNINPEANVRAALHLLACRTLIVGLSTFYRNAAVGGKDAPPFVNGMVEIRTGLSPDSLKNDILRPIEAQLGRVRSADKYAPRSIDLDLVLFDSGTGRQEAITLLDPDATRLAYLAVPLAELAPYLVLPGTDAPLARVAATLTDQPLEPLLAFSALLKKEILYGYKEG